MWKLTLVLLGGWYLTGCGAAKAPVVTGTGGNGEVPPVAIADGGSTTVDGGAPITGGGDGGIADGGATDGGSDGGDAKCPPVQLATGLAGAGTLQVDDQFVYFFSGSPRTLSRVPKTGGRPSQIGNAFGSIDDDVWAWSYAVDADHVYVMNYGESGATLAPGSVDIYDKSATLQRNVVASEPAGDCHVPILTQLAAGGGNVYWVQSEAWRDVNCGSAPNHVVMLTPNASSGTVLAATTDSGAVTGLAVAGDGVYWSDVSGVSRVPVAGGAAQLVMAGIPEALVTDGSAVFWSDFAAIYRADGGGAKLLSSQAFYVQAFDGRTLYGTSGIGRASTAQLTRIGGDGRGYSATTANVGAVAVDDSYVYYTDASGSTLLRACK